jgi:hypothetical protein
MTLTDANLNLRPPPREAANGELSKPSAKLAEVESILGKPLPTSAYKFTSWWSTLKGASPQAKAWLSAGFRVRVSMKQRIVEFYSDVERQ